MILATIVVPVYKNNPSELEWSSFRQLLEVMGKHQIALVTHQQLDVSNYLDAAKGKQISVARFPRKFFTGITAYNRLLLYPGFYRCFESSRFALIYQLDAWVFRDELEFWCNQGYHYIGAPWYEGYSNANKESQFLGVGNGGFSLRHVQAHMQVLNRFRFIHSFREYREIRYNETGSCLLRQYRLLRDFLLANNTYHLLNGFAENEDVFWGYHAPQCFNWFRVPTEKAASQFSMEVNAPRLYIDNGEVLPFGCHAWERYHPAFWSKFIQVESLAHFDTKS